MNSSKLKKRIMSRHLQFSKRENFGPAKFCILQKIPDLLIYKNWHLQNNQNQNVKNCEN